MILYKMNEILKKNCISSRQVYGWNAFKKTFTKNKERIEKIKETGYSNYIYRNDIT